MYLILIYIFLLLYIAFWFSVGLWAYYSLVYWTKMMPPVRYTEKRTISRTKFNELSIVIKLNMEYSKSKMVEGMKWCILRLSIGSGEAVLALKRSVSTDTAFVYICKLSKLHNIWLDVILCKLFHESLIFDWL